MPKSNAADVKNMSLASHKDGRRLSSSATFLHASAIFFRIRRWRFVSASWARRSHSFANSRNSFDGSMMEQSRAPYGLLLHTGHASGNWRYRSCCGPILIERLGASESCALIWCNPALHMIWIFSELVAGLVGAYSAAIARWGFQPRGRYCPHYRV